MATSTLEARFGGMSINNKTDPHDRETTYPKPRVCETTRDQRPYLTRTGCDIFDSTITAELCQ